MRMAVIACAAIIRRRNKLLITQRKPDQTYAFKWEFPGGRLEKGESKETCVKREIREELGIQIVSPAFYCTLRYRMGKSLLVIHYFLCKVTSGRIKKLEVEDFKWIEPKQFDDRALLHPDRTVLRMLLIDL
jgi:8-oxo-dGTP diphosphatase